MSTWLRPSPVWNPSSPRAITTVSAARAASTAAAKPERSSVLKVSSETKERGPLTSFAPSAWTTRVVGETAARMPSSSETAEFDCAWARQPPSGESLSAARGPMTAMLEARLSRGSSPASFLSSTIEARATSRAACLVGGVREDPLLPRRVGVAVRIVEEAEPELDPQHAPHGIVHQLHVHGPRAHQPGEVREVGPRLHVHVAAGDWTATRAACSRFST